MIRGKFSCKDWVFKRIIKSVSGLLVHHNNDVTPVLKVSRILNTFVKTDTGYIKSYNTESDMSRNSDTRVTYYII